MTTIGELDPLFDSPDGGTTVIISGLPFSFNDFEFINLCRELFG